MTGREKGALRKEILAWRTGLSAGEKSGGEAAILERLTGLAVWREADVILIYWATPHEIGTREIIRRAGEEQKSVALPRCDYDTRTLAFFTFRGEDSLIPGPMRLLEPDPARCPPAVYTAKSLCVVPALAADLRGYRLGYGGGWYDRFLPRFPGSSAALIWDRWLMETLPAEEYDRRVDWIVTPKEAWKVQIT